MSVIFDTNALSAFADGDEKLLQALGNEHELALPAIVLGEYLYGIHQSRLRATYQAWVKANLRLSFPFRWTVKPLGVTPRSGMS